MLNDTLTDKDGLFNIFAKSKQLGKMRPYLQVHHRCNTGEFPSTTNQVYRISWYRIPPHHVVPSVTENDQKYYLYPLSLNGEGFVETAW
uniref:Uncharacterized protein n=1 Tax=Panagrolaimus superbus TaxID=310955 RepID=A0A914Y1E4_9BILA